MKFLLKTSLAGLAITGLMACHSEDKKNTPATGLVKDSVTTFEKVEKGNILVWKATNDTTISYAIYIPAVYDGVNALPAIAFFDPHGNGSLPLSNYKLLAEKYGFIFIGSNNAKNGNSPEQNIGYAEALLKDVETKVKIAKGRFYAAGFSGGARVAAGWAIQNTHIAAVIGMGAGFPNTDKPIEHPFPYIGIAGNQDFNLTELEELDHQLSQSRIIHQLLTFNGKHEWCPTAVFDKAITWLNFKAMGQHLIAKDSLAIQAYIAKTDSTIDSQESKKLYYEALTGKREKLEFLYGLQSTQEATALENQIKTLKQNPVVQKAIERKKEIRTDEKQLREALLNALATKDEKWWKPEVVKMNDPSKFQADQFLMNQRILNFLSLACYMNINQMLANRQVPEAAHFVELYAIIDPTNAEAPYIKAKIANSGGDNKTCIAQIKKAVEMGFNEPDRFAKEFKKILPEQDFNTLYAAMVNNNSLNKKK